jgi:hypothetical protein
MPVATTRDRVIFKGTESIPLLAGPRTVTFPYEMPGDYDVYFVQPTGGLSITGITNKTSTGFTISLTVNLAGSITWAAVEIRNP